MGRTKTKKSPLERPVPGNWKEIVGDKGGSEGLPLFFKTEYQFYSESGLLTDPGKALAGVCAEALRAHVDSFGEATRCSPGKRVCFVYLDDVLRGCSFPMEQCPWSHPFLRDANLSLLLDGDFGNVSISGPRWGRRFFSRPWSYGQPVFFALSTESYFQAPDKKACCLYTLPMDSDIFITPTDTIGQLKMTSTKEISEETDSDYEDFDLDNEEKDKGETEMQRGVADASLVLYTECYECVVRELSFSDKFALTDRQRPLVAVPHPFEMPPDTCSQVIATMNAFFEEVECELGFGLPRAIRAISHLMRATEQDLILAYSRIRDDDCKARIIMNEYFLRAPWISSKAVKDIDDGKARAMLGADLKDLPFRQHFRLRDVRMDENHACLDETRDARERREQSQQSTIKQLMRMRWRVRGWNATTLFLHCERGYEKCFKKLEMRDNVLKHDIEKTLVELCALCEGSP